MKAIQYIIAAAALSLPLSSCVKDDLYNTPHPGMGALVVVPDFFQRTDGTAAPAEYVLAVDGGKECVASSLQQFCYPQLLTPASHSLVAYNFTQGIEVAGAMATVAVEADGLLVPEPGYLFTHSSPVTITADDTTRVEMPMQQRTRDLYIRLTITEGDAARVASVNGRLDGIAAGLDLQRGTLTADAGAVEPVFAVNGNSVESHVRLLGIAGSRQTLVIEVAFTDGRSQTVESDVTQLLANFGSDMTTPAEIRGNLLLPVAAGFDISITDLETDEREDVDLY